MSYLGDFLFPPRRAQSPVRMLSGGERNRLLLARLFARPANVLVLDEPTNDLDIESLELLEAALQDYAGTLLLVSHDRAFLDNVVTQTLAAEGDGKWKEYAGGYSDWLRQRALPSDSLKNRSSNPAQGKTQGQALLQGNPRARSAAEGDRGAGGRAARAGREDERRRRTTSRRRKRCARTRQRSAESKRCCTRSSSAGTALEVRLYSINDARFGGGSHDRRCRRSRACGAASRRNRCACGPTAPGRDAASRGAGLGAHAPAHHHRLQRIAARADHRRARRRRGLPGRADADPPVRLPRASATRCCGCRSMPCGLPTDETIPIGRYGTLQRRPRQERVPHGPVATATAGACRRSRGIHYNWSLPGLGNAEYFALIRNFRRHALLLLYLFGASPAVCSSFVAGRAPRLQALRRGTLYLPHATSLRMGRLGYQSDAQASLAVSYNSLRVLRRVAAGRADAHLSRLREDRHPQPRTANYNQLATSAAADRERVLRHDPPQARHPPGRAAAARAARARRRVRRSAPDGPRPLRAGGHHAADDALPRRVPAALPAASTARPTRRRRSPPSGATSKRSPRAAASRA